MTTNIFQKLPKKPTPKQLLAELERAHLMVATLALTLGIVLVVDIDISRTLVWIISGLLVLVILASVAIMLGARRYAANTTK